MIDIIYIIITYQLWSSMTAAVPLRKCWIRIWSDVVTVELYLMNAFSEKYLFYSPNEEKTRLFNIHVYTLHIKRWTPSIAYNIYIRLLSTDSERHTINDTHRFHEQLAHTLQYVIIPMHALYTMCVVHNISLWDSWCKSVKSKTFFNIEFASIHNNNRWNSNRYFFDC